MRFLTAGTVRRLRATAIMSLYAGLATFSFGGIAQAKDLYVATNGNDSVSYAANDQANPWQTIGRGISSLQAGDTLYIRSGVYPQPSTIDAKDIAQSGTAASPVTITGFPGEQVVLDLSAVTVWMNLRNKSYWEISNLEFVNAQRVMELALGFPTDNIVIRNNRMVMNRGGDNHAAIMVNGGGSNTVIDGNEIVGPGFNVSTNTGCIYVNQVTSIKVLNNRMSNAPIGFHYKHANANSPSADIEFAYNHITDTSRSAIHYNGNYGFIHDNIFAQNNGDVYIGMENGVPGGNNNIFEHNTFFGTRLYLTEAGGNVLNNVVRNNLFTTAINIAEWNNNPHNTTLDYNLHPTGVAIREHGNGYTLPQWRSYYGGSASSIAGSPTFVGGTNPTLTAGFRLTASSTGVGSASDGADMGARLDLFGTSGLNLPRPLPPQALNVN